VVAREPPSGVVAHVAGSVFPHPDSAVGAASIWFVQEPNGRHMWGSKPAAGSPEEATELVDDLAA
jgi:hypothetical protein